MGFRSMFMHFQRLIKDSFSMWLAMEWKDLYHESSSPFLLVIPTGLFEREELNQFARDFGKIEGHC